MWVLQSIAAFPMRDDATHPSVYVCYLVIVRCSPDVRRCAWPARRSVAILVVAAVAVVVPWPATSASYADVGTAWQGRYALPLRYRHRW